MRRSRSLTFKKEQEQKQSQPQPQPQRQQPPRLKSPPPQLNRPQQTKINYQSQPQSHEVEDSDNDDVPLSKVSHSSKQPPKKQPPSKHVDDEEEEHYYEDDEHYDQEEEEDEEQLPPPPKTRPSSAKPKQTINLSTQKDQEEQPTPSKQRGRSPGRKPASTAPVTSPKSRPVQQEEEHHEQDDDEEVRESKEGSTGDKRKRLILSKILFQKLLSTCEIESTTSDIINHTEADLIEYVQDVIKVISNNEEDDEVVVRDSSLKFLGDKSKAQGLLDQKTFDKIFQEAIANVSTNITFTSEAYKSLCKYTEVHVLDMLTKVKAIMKHSGRKRLNTSDVEFLKFSFE